MHMDKRKPNIQEDWAIQQWQDVVNDSASARDVRLLKLKRIGKELSEPTPMEFGVYVAGCASLAVSSAKLALQEFSNSKIVEGWKLISDALIYKLTEFKIKYALGFPCADPGVLNDASLLLATSLAINSRDVGEWTAQFILETEANPKFMLRPKEPNEFLCLCYLYAAEVCGSGSKKVWRNAIDDGFYSPLWNATSIEETQEAIGSVAITRAKLCLESLCDFPPFALPPFNLFPVDILAILRMQDFENVEFDSGGLESALCHPPVELPWKKPTTVERIEARVREKYDFPTVDWK